MNQDTNDQAGCGSAASEEEFEKELGEILGEPGGESPSESGDDESSEDVSGDETPAVSDDDCDETAPCGSSPAPCGA